MTLHLGQKRPDFTLKMPQLSINFPSRHIFLPDFLLLDEKTRSISVHQLSHPPFALLCNTIFKETGVLWFLLRRFNKRRLEFAKDAKCSRFIHLPVI
jgi:hypothetical protein